MDGRDQQPVLGTPGGDLGEFLVALSVVKQLRQKDFAPADVDRLLHDWLLWEKKGTYPMYLETDEEALSYLAKHLHVNGLSGVVNDVKIDNPEPKLRKEILLVQDVPANQGAYKCFDY